MNRNVPIPLAIFILLLVAGGMWYALWQFRTHEKEPQQRPAPSPAPSPQPSPIRGPKPVATAHHDSVDWKGISALGKGAVPKCLEFMKGDDPADAIEACSVLAKLGGDAVPALVDLLKNGEGRSRSWAAFALGEMGPAAKAALPALEEAKKVHALSTVAAEAIARISK